MEQYLCIDQKSFYASVECVARGLDPMKTLLVVADAERSVNTICLAVSVAAKARGIRNRCRLGDVPKNLDVLIARPRMQLYIDCAAEIYGVFLRFFAPEDIYTYSIDESFIYVTPYLKMYGMTARELAKKVVEAVREVVGTVSTCGIGTNLFLAKVALDILAKHAPDFIAELTEDTFRDRLWNHTPITDFWRVGPGIAGRLRSHGITDMQGITQVAPEILYRMFGINAELLIDHAWGRETCTIADIKAYHSQSGSLSSTQVLMRDYTAAEALVVAKEMADNLCMRLTAKELVTESVSLYIGYSHAEGDRGTGGSTSFPAGTDLAGRIVPAVEALYRRIVREGIPIRRIAVCFQEVRAAGGGFQLNMFEDANAQIKGRALQQTLLELRRRYGKNAVLKGMNYDPAATGRQRNLQIGGHRSGFEDGQSPYAEMETGSTVRNVRRGKGAEGSDRGA